MLFSFVHQSALYSITNQIFPYLSDIVLLPTWLVKTFLKQKPLNCSRKVFLLPGHPIAGTEYSGAKSAKLNLFLNKWCILTPIKKKKDKCQLFQIFGKELAKISIMSANQHDKIMSITSHLPHLIAFTIVGTAFKIDLKKKRIN